MWHGQWGARQETSPARVLALKPSLYTRSPSEQGKVSPRPGSAAHPDIQRPEVRKPYSSLANPLAQDRASDKVRRNQESCPAASGEDSLTQDAVVISSSQSHREKTE